MQPTGPKPSEELHHSAGQGETQAAHLFSRTTSILEKERTAPVRTELASKNGHQRKRSPLREHVSLSRSRSLFLLSLLFILLLHSIQQGSGQFLSSEGWAHVLTLSSTSNSTLLQNLGQHHGPGGSPSFGNPQFHPERYIDTIINRMTLDQKLGQMMLVQFAGPDYSLDLSTMISQYNIGAVLIFSANGNIANKAQLKSLIQQMQRNSPIPLAEAIDQEGGYVDRLVDIDGPRPSAASIGATNDVQKASTEGARDAEDLRGYGINLNLAPVVDVTNVYNPQLDTRTFGNNPALVTKMAAAYLAGLQRSGAVVGTLKHFPGLGDVGVDPHQAVPYLHRSKAELEQIDWQPYHALIQQGNVHAIMVTHEIVTALDATAPSSLSNKVVTGILRNELGFQGVIMTDSLTMQGITAYYTEAQAAALAVEAGSDLLMGASTPSDIATMIGGIKQALNAGTISQQRIDDSVRRILMMKYAMGLLPIPAP